MVMLGELQKWGPLFLSSCSEDNNIFKSFLVHSWGPAVYEQARCVKTSGCPTVSCGKQSLLLHVAQYVTVPTTSLPLDSLSTNGSLQGPKRQMVRLLGMKNSSCRDPFLHSQLTTSRFPEFQQVAWSNSAGCF